MEIDLGLRWGADRPKLKVSAGGETPKSRGRPKVRSNEEQMDVIVTKAMSLFLDGGLANIKMDVIAALCKISKRTLYSLFPSKLDLFRAMVERHRQSMICFSTHFDELPLEEALMGMFAIELDPVADDRRAAFIDRAITDAIKVPAIGEILNQYGDGRAKLILAEWLIERKQEDASNIRDPYSAASILTDMIFGAIAVKPLQESAEVARAQKQLYLRDCIHYFVNGVK